LAVFGSAASAQTFTVSSPTQVAVTQPLRQVHDSEQPTGHQVRYHPLLPARAGGPSQTDTALQTTAGPLISATAGAVFDGVGANCCAPPDTNMAVGQNPAFNYILQTVNSRYAIYNKSGGLVLGPNSLSSLWSALGNGCATQNAGDVVAQYDKAADRWIITQLGGTASPYLECIAVSKTADPTGVYNLYSFSYGTTLNDYPKFGVWPTATNSAYLASYNLFSNGQNFAGGQLCAYDRTKMLTGDATAQSICTTISNDGGFLPSDLDGSTAPVDGTPGYFLNFETLSSLRMYAMHPNFANPSASTLSVLQDIGVSSFSEACGGGTCVPQSGTTQQLDSLGDRLMYRLAFRNFGDHEAMVVNHSVSAGTSVGVRWYELRAPVSSTATFSLFQQGTFAPDATYRWMGSAAMDSSGNIGLGYSASNGSIHPAIRYTGRQASDPAGTMSTEASIIEGTGSQTTNLSRWGDYTALRIDPADDCTFWYTNEYIKTNGTFNWSTGIGSFKFTSCGVAASPDFSMSSNPASVTVTQGQTGSSTVTVASSNSFNSAVTLTVSGCPANATCTVNPISVTPAANGSATSALSIVTTSATVAGTYTVTVAGASGTLNHSTAVALTVNAAPVPDFSISSSPTSVTLTQGGNGSSTVTVTSTNGFSSAVGLTVTGCPANATCTVNPTSVTPVANGSVTSALSLATTASTAAGTYTITIDGTSSGALNHSTTVTLTVNAPAADFTISASPTSLTVLRSSNGSYTVSVGAVGASSSVTLSVSGLPSRTHSSFSPNPVNSGGTSKLTISANRNAPVGSYALTITGSNGNFSHPTQVTLQIQ